MYSKYGGSIVNDELYAMIDGYISEATDCVYLNDDMKSINFFKRMNAGMIKQPGWSYPSFDFGSAAGDGTYLEEMPNVIEALKSYKIARQFEERTLYVLEKKSPQMLVNVHQKNQSIQEQSQSQSQYNKVDINQIIEWVQQNQSIGQPETEEILYKIEQMQEIALGSDQKKSKWEKMKPFLDWLGTKGVDLAAKLLPLILSSIE